MPVRRDFLTTLGAPTAWSAAWPGRPDAGAPRTPGLAAPVVRARPRPGPPVGRLRGPGEVGYSGGVTLALDAGPDPGGSARPPMLPSKRYLAQVRQRPL